MSSYLWWYLHGEGLNLTSSFLSNFPIVSTLLLILEHIDPVKSTMVKMVSRPFVQPSQNPIALKEYSDYFNAIAETGSNF